MDILKKILLFSFFLLAFNWGNEAKAQNSTKVNLKKNPPSVTFTPEDIEKIKTLIEKQLNSKISQAEFSMFGKATKDNLALFKRIDELQKEDPFFSQPHISYIVESMEFRLGLNRPKSNAEVESEKVQPKTEEVANISKLPKNKSDLH